MLMHGAFNAQSESRTIHNIICLKVDRISMLVNSVLSAFCDLQRGQILGRLVSSAHRTPGGPSVAHTGPQEVNQLCTQGPRRAVNDAEGTR